MAVVCDKIKTQGKAVAESEADSNSQAVPNNQIRILSDASDDENDDKDLHTLKVNKKYAKRFHEKQRRDDIFRAKEMGLLEGGSSDDEDEDENGEALTKSLDVDILKTISMIRKKDRRIYDKSYKPFQQEEKDDDDDDEVEEEENNTGEEKGKSKNRAMPFTYKDMVRQKAENAIMNNGQVIDGEETDSDAEPENQVDPSYAEKQKQLKDAFKNINSDDNDEDDILQLKVKTKQDKQKEDNDFATFINSVNQNKKASEKLKSNMGVLESYFKEPAKDKDEEFLRSYVLNKGWVSKYVSDDEDGENEEEKSGKNETVEDSDDADLEEFEKAEEFENKYNFRFEEPDAHVVKTYPRKIESSLRREKNARKRRREEKTKRKLELKKQREEEIKRLKNLKKEELKSRLEKAKSVAGLKADRMLFTEKDMDDEFDPEKHDAMMKRMFDDNYYAEDDTDFKKPDISDLMDGEDIVDEEVEGDEEVHDYEEKENRKGASTSYLSETDMDEIYKLDYEGTAGDVKTRFRYAKVKPDSWGLSTEEILETDDTVLNEYVSLKKIVPYLGFDWKVTQKRRRRFRQRVKEANRTKKEQKLLGKRRIQNRIGEVTVDADANPGDKEKEQPTEQKIKATSEVSKCKRKRKHKKKVDADVTTKTDNSLHKNLSDETKITEKKKRKRKRKKSKTNLSTEPDSLS